MITWEKIPGSPHVCTFRVLGSLGTRLLHNPSFPKPEGESNNRVIYPGPGPHILNNIMYCKRWKARQWPGNMVKNKVWLSTIIYPKHIKCTVDREIFTLKIIRIKSFRVDKFSRFCSILEIFLRKMFIRVLNFCSWSQPWNYFNSEIFPIYGMLYGYKLG